MTAVDASERREGASPLQELAPGLFVHDGAKRFFGFRIHRCMTVVRLAGDRLVVHSPNALEPPLRAALDRLGTVAFVVAPNAMHGFAVDQVAAAYPEAKVFVAPHFPARNPRVRVDRVLGDRPEPEWADVLDQAVVAGDPFLCEVVFLHRPTRTLIVTDLVENMGREHLSGWGRLVCRLYGVYGRPAPSPEHLMYTLEPEAAAASLARVQAWDFDRIVPAHGSRIERDAKETFARVVERLLDTARRRRPWRRRLNARLARMM